MLLFGLITFLTLAIWTAVLFRVVGWSGIQKIIARPIPLICVLVVIVGSALGREFFAIESALPITLDRILLGFGLALFLIMTFLGYEKIQPMRVVDLLIFAMVGYLFLSTIAHDWSTRENLPASRLLFFNLVPLGLYWLVRNAKISSFECQAILFCLIGFGVYLALTGLAEWRGWNWAVFPRYITSESFAEFLGRARGPFLNPVSNGTFMIVGLTALMLVWFAIPKPRVRLVLAGLVPVFLIGIYATLTRSVWLALILGLGLTVWMRSNRQQRSVLLIAGFCGAFLVAITAGDKIFEFKRDKNVSSYEMKQSASLRPLFAIIAVRMFEDRPLVGHGFGQYTNAKLPYLHDPESKHPLWMTKPYMQHNIFLAYLTETGLIGLTMLLLVLAFTGRSAIKLWQARTASIWIRSVGLLMIVFLICHGVNGMFHDVSIAPMINMLFFFIAGLTVNLESRFAPVTQNATALAESRSLVVTSS